MSRSIPAPIILALATSLLVAGCTTTGSGVATSRAGAPQGTFHWTSDDGVRGSITAELMNGQTYTGIFFQITQETQVDDLRPLWSGWEGRGRWRGWTGWGADDFRATTYSGTVLANLQDASSRKMRCRFKLASPASGLSGGGFGRCQLADGSVIYAEFPAQ